MTLVPIRLGLKCVCVLSEPRLASSFGDRLDEGRLGHCGDVDPKLSCAIKRLGIKCQRGLALRRSHHTTTLLIDTVKIYRSAALRKLGRTQARIDQHDLRTWPDGS